jgi:hypothetical protein
VQHRQPQHEQIQICQKGLAHLPATKPKSMACTPSPAPQIDEEVAEDEDAGHA